MTSTNLIKFHHKTGNMVTLSNENRTAQRNSPYHEFNNGLVMSSEPLSDSQLFQVRIDKKVPTWSGSIEIGVTSLDPATLKFPSSASSLEEGSWIISGTSVLQDGRPIVEEYGEDLDQLNEGDCVGILRTSSGDLHLYVNGADQGVAATGISPRVYAMVDMYGKCAQVSVVDSSDVCLMANSMNGENINLSYSHAHKEVPRLTFHDRCGSMVKLSSNNCTAERKRPVDEFNNGVVMTNRPLMDNELFEIRIDELVNKWSGSIEMGVTTHSPETLDFPATMTNMRSGTIMMSGCGILTNGKGSRREYGEFNLDELHEGDRIGLIKKSNGNLHYFINGLDQGIAANNIPPVVYGVVDLYGMTVKVTITDSCISKAPDHSSSEDCISLPTHNGLEDQRRLQDDDKLLFHPRCGGNVSVLNGGSTAKRPRALDVFNNAVVLTSRPLHPGELFEVVLEQVVMKWAGSIEIGVTTHAPQDLEYPSTMTNIRSGTWMMTGSGIMYNGTTITDDYGRNLDKLKTGDHVGVLRKTDGDLHFFINGVDQGLATTNVPERVYGVIDLYGQAAKASIVYHSGNTSATDDLDFSSTVADISRDAWAPHVSSLVQEGASATAAYKSDLDPLSLNAKSEIMHHVDDALHYANGEGQGADVTVTPSGHFFNSICGRNTVLKNNKTVACRVRSFNHGLVFSARPLESDELFEIQVTSVNAPWAGSLHLGMTSFCPSEQVSLPASTADMVGYETWALVGNQVHRNGHLLKDNYGPSLSRLMVGDRVGIRRSADGSMHGFFNGIDLGVATINLPKKLYAFVDLQGSVDVVRIFHQFTSPSIVPHIPVKNTEKEDFAELSKKRLKENGPVEFHENHGRNIQLINNNLTARRVASYNQGVVMTSKTLCQDQLFQVKIDGLHPRWSSCVQIGITSNSPEKLHFPISALSMRKSTWIVCGDSVFQNGIKIKGRYGPNLENLQIGHVIGIKVDTDNRLHLYVNGVDQGVAADDIPLPCYGLVDVYGQCEQVTVVHDDNLQESNTEREYIEKADIDTGMKEKLLKSEIYPVRNCEFQNMCGRFKDMLGLPEGFFISELNVCYCDTCYKLRGDEPYYRKGEPPRDYALPFGWCRFALRLSRKAENMNIQDKWHVAFHGTYVKAVRRILDNGELLSPGEMVLGSLSRTSTRKSSSKDVECSQVFLSPTLRYAGTNKFSPEYEYLDPDTKKLLHAQVAFQILVRPGSYTISPRRLADQEPFDFHFSNNDLEWYTKEQGSIVLHCLLIRLEGL